MMRSKTGDANSNWHSIPVHYLDPGWNVVGVDPFFRLSNPLDTFFSSNKSDHFSTSRSRIHPGGAMAIYTMGLAGLTNSTLPLSIAAFETVELDCPLFHICLSFGPWEKLDL
jgi:hypothetical protein